MEPKSTQEKNKTPGAQMGSTPAQTGSQPGTPAMGGQATGAATARQPTPERTERVGQEERGELRERGAEFAGRAKQTFNEAYERTSRTLNESYEHAMDYGREHPGQAVLIAFGVGVGVGLWLSSTVNARSRTSRIVPHVMNALSDIASEVFR